MIQIHSRVAGLFIEEKVSFNKAQFLQEVTKLGDKWKMEKNA